MVNLGGDKGPADRASEHSRLLEAQVQALDAVLRELARTSLDSPAAVALQASEERVLAGLMETLDQIAFWTARAAASSRAESSPDRGEPRSAPAADTRSR